MPEVRLLAAWYTQLLSESCLHCHPSDVPESLGALFRAVPKVIDDRKVQHHTPMRLVVAQSEGIHGVMCLICPPGCFLGGSEGQSCISKIRDHGMSETHMQNLHVSGTTD